MRHSFTYTCAALLVLGLAACDTYTQDDYRPEYVVESYLVAGEPLPLLRLSQTAPIDARYTFEDFAVEGADVRVNLLDETGAVEETYPYVQTKKGIYEPEDETAVVQPLRTYALEVRVPGHEEVIRSKTLVPGPFEIVSISQDTIVYQGAEQLEAWITSSHHPDREPVYVFTIFAMDTTNYDLTPVYADFADDDDGLHKVDFVANSSGLTKEEGFTKHADGTLSIKLPWILVAFYGPNEIVANAIDDNLFDFKRSQLGTGTTSPGEMDNLIDHIEGGRGIFGSMSRARVVIHVNPQGAE